jgi:type VI secretion system protein ImpC
MAEMQRQGAAGVQTLEGGSLLDEILAETKMTPGDEGYEVAKKGVQAFIAELIAPKREGEKVDKALVDALIAEIDAKLSRQIDEILHNPTFQKLESAWRGLKFVVDRTDFRENVKLELYNCSKEDLLADFEDAPEVPKSGLYKVVYSAEFGQFGGRPYGAIIANYEFGPGPQYIMLLQ